MSVALVQGRAFHNIHMIQKTSGASQIYRAFFVSIELDIRPVLMEHIPLTK